MFEGLRKKISDAVKGIAKKEKAEEKIEEQKAENLEKVEEPQIDNKVEDKIEGKVEEKKSDNALDIKISAGTKLKGIFLGTVHLSDVEIEDFIEELRISFLESDVSYKTTEDFLLLLQTRLKDAKLKSKNLKEEMIENVREALLDVLKKSAPTINIQEMIKSKIEKGEVPVRILFLGPNGTGKTTTMGKLAYNLKKVGINSVFSASDTFRAAAIEQTEHHANKIGVPVIKSKYGADPAGIAFDTIEYARAHSIPLVLIDTAGRQETNKNLVNEMKKMLRVAKPDLTIFIGESTAGNALSNQIEEFSKYIKIDGIILTKLDCDAKGGNAISIADTTGIPILFFGVGESYDAIIPYTPEFVVNSILPNN
jgi:fused signal recognition particle receptor